MYDCCNHGLNIILEIFLVTAFILREMGVYRKKPEVEVNWKSAYYSDETISMCICNKTVTFSK